MRDTFEGAQHAINCSVCALCKALYAIMDAKPEAADIRRMHGSDLGPIKKKTVRISVRLDGRAAVVSAASRHGIGASAEVKAMLQGPMTRIADAVRNRNGSAIEP